MELSPAQTRGFSPVENLFKPNFGDSPIEPKLWPNWNQARALKHFQNKPEPTPAQRIQLPECRALVYPRWKWQFRPFHRLKPKKKRRHFFNSTVAPNSSFRIWLGLILFPDFLSNGACCFFPTMFLFLVVPCMWLLLLLWQKFLSSLKGLMVCFRTALQKYSFLLARSYITFNWDPTILTPACGFI